MEYAVAITVVLILCFLAYKYGGKDTKVLEKKVEIKTQHVASTWEVYTKAVADYRELRDEFKKASEKCTCGAYTSSDFANRLYKKYTSAGEKRVVPGTNKSPNAAIK
jgi:hypothetical protein